MPWGSKQQVLIFDQHRVFVDDVAAALERAAVEESEKKIAIEANTLEEALQFVKAGFSSQRAALMLKMPELTRR